VNYCNLREKKGLPKNVWEQQQQHQQQQQHNKKSLTQEKMFISA